MGLVLDLALMLFCVRTALARPVLEGYKDLSLSSTYCGSSDVCTRRGGGEREEERMRMRKRSG